MGGGAKSAKNLNCSAASSALCCRVVRFALQRAGTVANTFGCWCGSDTGFEESANS